LKSWAISKASKTKDNKCSIKRIVVATQLIAKDPEDKVKMDVKRKIGKMLNGNFVILLA